jgi:5-methylcytosine-specific restriction endonuclease McrA
MELRLDGVPAGARPAPVKRTLVEPTAPGRYKVQFTAGAELCEKLERLQALMRRTVPDADLASIIEQAVSEKLERLEAVRYAKVKQPRAAAPAASAVTTPRKTSARRIPAAIRRAVYARDGGRCRYTDREGRRCTARHDLEFHHRHPFGHGGAHTAANVCLACATHHRMLSESDYGRLGPPGPRQAPPSHSTP